MHELCTGSSKVAVLLLEFGAQAASRTAVARHLIGLRYEQSTKLLQASPRGPALGLEPRQQLTAFLDVGVDGSGDEFVLGFEVVVDVAGRNVGASAMSAMVVASTPWR